MKQKMVASFAKVILAIALSMCLCPTSALAQKEDGALDQTPSDSVLAASSADLLVSGNDSKGQDDSDVVVWTTADFIYEDYAQLLYGCDYSRQFTVSGKAISGFSEAGEEKLSQCTDLVIPADDPYGNPIVAIGRNAFYDKGLTSVSFPTGMMVPYDDQLTERVTKRGNFVIAESAFGKNELTELYLPSGIVAVMSGAFQNNKLESVTLPQSIWWIETASFARNKIEHVYFPTTTDFHLEMHGMAFAANRIESVRLPDYTEVVNKDTFAMNPGMEESPDSYDKKAQIIASGYPCGVVYMYTDNAALASKDRIHHIDRTTGSTKSYTQKLVINDGSAATQNPDSTLWRIEDFVIEGTTVKGLSESGIAKRKVNKHLSIPSYNTDWDPITEIASTTELFGVFGSEDEGFESVELPQDLKTIGDRAFARNGLKDVIWAPNVESVGLAAFQDNNLTSVIMPDTVTQLGEGAFATNELLERIGLSSGLKEIADGAFGCSDANHWMVNLKNVDIPDGITRIGANAFAGNNFECIVVPASVKEIGRFAFSTKNYLKTPCTLTLNEGLETIGPFAFRNKIIATVKLPTTVKALPNNTFLKAYSASVEDTVPMITKVLAVAKGQCADKELFPSPCEDSHVIIDEADLEWTPEDFQYGTLDISNEDVQLADQSSDKLEVAVHVVTGLSELGEERLALTTDLVIPDVDPDGNAVCGVGVQAFAKRGITSVSFPAAVTCANDKPEWNDSVSQRGNFFIGASAFFDNEITDLELPEGVFAVFGNAFGSNHITSIDLPSTLFYIGNQAFAKNQIQQVRFSSETDFPLQVASMAFGQNQIRALQIPDNIGYLHKWTFFQNTGMEPVVSDNEYEAQGGVVHLYISDANAPGRNVASLSRGTSNVQTLIEGAIPVDDAYGPLDFTYSGSSITGWSATGKLKRLTNHDLVLPDTTPNGTIITSIGDGAFRSPDDEIDYESAKYDYTSRYGIRSVKLPINVQAIGEDAFAFNSLTAVEFPETLTSIGDTAFKGNHILRVTLPDSVTLLGSGAFAANSLVEIGLSKGLTSIAPGAFSMNIRLDHIDLHEGLTNIGDTAFAGARLTSLNIPSTVTSIGRKAFHLHRLTSLVIPGTVKTLGDNAFEGTYKGQTLKSLSLGEGIQSIGSGAFKEGLLKTVILPSSLRWLGSEPFENNTGKNASQVVELVTKNRDHLRFNTGARTHIVVLDASMIDLDNSNDSNIKPAEEKAAPIAAKAKQPLKAKAKKRVVTVRYAKLKKKAVGISNIKFTKKAQGQVAYKNVSKNKKAKKFKITKKGVVKVTKKLKKGIYPVRVKITATGNSKYKSGSVIVTFKVRVK